jgi:hypothetical protein
MISALSGRKKAGCEAGAQKIRAALMGRPSPLRYLLRLVDEGPLET